MRNRMIVRRVGVASAVLTTALMLGITGAAKAEGMPHYYPVPQYHYYKWATLRSVAHRAPTAVLARQLPRLLRLRPLQLHSHTDRRTCNVSNEFESVFATHIDGCPGDGET
jgi:hypothetical protein